MPPVVTTTAWAVSSKSPTTSRFDGAPRGPSSGARTAPRTPVTAPPVTTSSSTRCRWRKRDEPARPRPRSALRTNGSTTPVPVPQVTWNRGTELPCPPARRSPRSAQPTVGQPAEPERRQPRALLPGGELDVGPRPPDGQRVLVVEAVELRAALPVAPRQLDASRARPAAAARGCRRGTGRRTTTTPGRRGRRRSPGRRARRACRGRSARGSRPGRRARRRRRRHPRPRRHPSLSNSRRRRPARRDHPGHVADREAGPRGCHADRRHVRNSRGHAEERSRRAWSPWPASTVGR